MNLETLNEYILLQIFEFLDIISLTRLQRSSKRNFGLAYRVIANSPGIVSESNMGSSFDSTKLFEQISRLSTIPTFILCIGENSGPKVSSFYDQFSAKCPKSTHVVIAKCRNVFKPKRNQKRSLSSTQLSSTKDDIKLNQDTISSKYSIFIAGLPDTFCSSFYVKNDLFVNDSFELTDNDLISYGMKNVNENWELFIVFASPTGRIENFISALQTRYRKAVIIGGIYSQQIALFRNNEFKHNNNCLAVLALRGRLPLRTVVSRGHEAVSPIYRIPSNGSECLVDPEHCEMQISVIQQVGMPTTTSPITVLSDIINNHHHQGQIYMIGTRYNPSYTNDAQNSSFDITKNSLSDSFDSEGFELQPISDHTFYGNEMLLFLERQKSIPNELQFFIVTEEASRDDVIITLELSKQKFQSEGQLVLGTLMFSCCGRGPQPGFFHEEDFDAMSYQNTFPNIPLLGCYVDGEIGPQCLAGIDRKTSLFASSHTQCCVQGFTAVFCLFTVPPRKSIHEMMSSIHFMESSTQFSAEISHAEYDNKLFHSILNHMQSR